MEIFQRTEIRRVSIPCIYGRVAVRYCRPVHLHETRSRFDQSSRQKESLAEGGTTVLVPHVSLFLLQIKCSTRLAREQESVRFLVILIEGV